MTELSDRRKVEVEKRWEHMERDGILYCAYCKEEPAEHYEHKTARVNGGNNWLYNMAPACKDCNMRKRGRNYDVYLRLCGKKYPELWLNCQTPFEYFVRRPDLITPQREYIPPEPAKTEIEKPELFYWDGPLPDWSCKCTRYNPYTLKCCPKCGREPMYIYEPTGARVHLR